MSVHHHKIHHHHHKLLIGIAAIVILVIGLVLGTSLASNLNQVDMDAINIGLQFTIIILLLITGGIVVEIKDILLYKPGKK